MGGAHSFAMMPENAMQQGTLHLRQKRMLDDGNDSTWQSAPKPGNLDLKSGSAEDNARRFALTCLSSRSNDAGLRKDKFLLSLSTWLQGSHCRRGRGLVTKAMEPIPLQLSKDAMKSELVNPVLQHFNLHE